ncbi:MAG: hypothetical protein Q7K16_00085 [Candidatus Azambacteria bacterium]|nr:hypothetical protein [Candidatus Azambacteria bacterium]
MNKKNASESKEGIKWSQKDVERFLKEQGSPFFKLESEVFGAYGADQKQLLYTLLNFVTKLVQTVGVVAGFGFVGLGYVQNLYLFVIGEAFLFMVIISGLGWTQYVYKANLDCIQSEQKRIKELFGNRYVVFRKIFDKAAKDFKNGPEIFIPREWFIELMEKGDEIEKNFASQIKDKNEWMPFNLFMILFIGGVIGLLFSFASF